MLPSSSTGKHGTTAPAGRVGSRPASVWAVVALVGIVSGCRVELDASVHPVGDAEQAIWPLDVDDDGTSELVQVYSPGKVNNHLGVGFRKLDGTVLHQVNVVGVVGQPLEVARPGRRNAAVVPFYRSDSLWALIVDVVGQRQDTVFVASGRPRVEPSGVFAWDPRLIHAEIDDFDGDGDEELLSVVNTGYARAPRGFFLHDIATGRFLDSLSLAVGLPSEIVPLSGEGPSRRWLIGSTAPDNGVRGRNLDDRRSFLVRVEYDGAFRVAGYRQMGGLFTDTQIMTGGRDSDELTVAVIKGDKDNEASFVARVDPDDLSIVDRLELPGMVISAVDPPVQSLADWSIIASLGSGELIRVPASLDRTAMRSRTRVPSVGSLVPMDDLDGDGLGEVIFGLAGHLEIVGNDLATLAEVDLPSGITGQIFPVMDPASESRQFIVGGPEGPAYLLTVSRDYRFPAWLLALLGTIFLGVAVVGAASALRRSTHFGIVRHLERNGLLRISPPEPPSATPRTDAGRGGETIDVPATPLEWLLRRRTVQRIDRAAGALSEADATANNRWAAGVSLPAEVAAASEPLARIVAALDRLALDRDTSVASLAESLGMSQRHLQRTCEALFGLSPLELITRRRVLAAAERLAATDDLVKEIAWDCGFGPSGQMEAAFKKHFGVLPTEYRAAARKA